MLWRIHPNWSGVCVFFYRQSARISKQIDPPPPHQLCISIGDQFGYFTAAAADWLHAAVSSLLRFYPQNNVP